MENNSSLAEKYERANIASDLETIQGIILELNVMSREEKIRCHELYKNIGIDLFMSDISLRNYDLDAYESSMNSKVSPKTTAIVSKKASTPKAEDFDEIFCGFYKRTQEIFPDLKYHFLFQLQNNEAQETSLLIITDEKFSDNPLLTKIVNKNTAIKPQQFTIQQFLDKAAKFPDMLEQQYIILLAISPTIGTNPELSSLKELFSQFKNCLAINPHKVCDLTKLDYSYKKADAFWLGTIEKITTNFLNNKAINHEEEKIIKLLLTKNAAITDYTILKSGFSGSKVILVQTVKDIPGSAPIKYVIKFSQITADRKIHNEREAFKEYLREFGVEGYSCDYEETELYEAIQYNYASVDSRKESYPFAEMIADYVSGKHKIEFDLVETISELFQCAPFQKWKGTTQFTGSVKSIYDRYLDESNVLAAICRIENKSIEEVQQSPLYSHYQTIIETRVNVNRKICHGDLHTENFFKDDDDVYLIDFGYTGPAHALLDHTTLEASIKFKHIPFYVGLEELLPIEKELMKQKLFKDDLDISFIKRPALKELFRIILQVRQESIPFFRSPDNSLEYFISLFMISFRQIQYKDLNQRYALEYAKLLGEYIVGKL